MNIHGLVDWRMANSVAQARVYCDNKTQQICLIHNYNMTFEFHPVNVSIIHLRANIGLELRAVSRASPIVTSRGAP